MNDLSLDETAVVIHEAYGSFMRAGFTEAQAMELVKAMIAGINK